MAAEPAAPEPSGMAFDQIVDNSLSLLQSGGVVVAILLVLSVFASAIVVAKLLQFRAARLGDRQTAPAALALYRRGDGARAMALASASANPAAQALARALNGRRLQMADAAIQAEVARYGNRCLAELRSWLRPLEVIASLAPLLGLFGTVLGMIAAFRALEAAGNQVNPAILSGGIWEALLTTAVGLAIAIPTVAALNWLERRVERLAEDMEDAVAGVFTEDLNPHPEMQADPRQERRDHARAGDAAAVSSRA